MVCFTLPREQEVFTVVWCQQDCLPRSHLNSLTVQTEGQRATVYDNHLKVVLFAWTTHSSGGIYHLSKNDRSPGFEKIHPGYIFRVFRHGHPA